MCSDTGGVIYPRSRRSTEGAEAMKFFADGADTNVSDLGGGNFLCGRTLRMEGDTRVFMASESTTRGTRRC